MRLDVIAVICSISYKPAYHFRYRSLPSVCPGYIFSKTDKIKFFHEIPITSWADNFAGIEDRTRTNIKNLLLPEDCSK